MEDSGHREIGRHMPEMYKSPQSQWLLQQPQSMKHIISIMAERDAAIQERNMAINEKNKALEERDLAIMQRDTAIQERDEAIMERDTAMSALQFRQNSINSNNSCPPGCQISRGIKHMHHPQHHSSHVGEASYDGREVQVSNPVPLTSLPPVNTKPRKPKRTKNQNPMSHNNKTSKVKREGEDLNEMGGSKPAWNGPDLGLNQVVFEDSTMPPPVCSCTGVYRQCYKWGNGGWQSSCCTTTVSMYPLPTLPNKVKRHARVGGRKMSGGVFNRLLSRLAADGHDLSTPVDLKEHWAKHGTNRYITIR